MRLLHLLSFTGWGKVPALLGLCVAGLLITGFVSPQHQSTLKRTIATPAVDSRFQTYYVTHNGPTLLGNPIAEAREAEQYFQRGRLEDHSSQTSDTIWRFQYGLVVNELQLAAVQVPVDGRLAISYADIHEASAADKMVAPPAGFTHGIGRYPDGSVFVPFKPDLSPGYGHRVPFALWQLLNSVPPALGGWLHDAGLPLTEVISTKVATGPAAGHDVLVQAFQRALFIYDPLSGQSIQRANTGLDYAAAYPASVYGPSATSPALAPVPPTTTPVPASSGTPVPDLEAALLAQINSDRSKHGRAPLVLDPAIVAVARAHDEDMIIHHFFSHYGSDGSSPLQRLRRGGITWTTYHGENWGVHYISTTPTAALFSINHWMMGEGPGGPHYENLLGRNFRRIGIGVLIAPNNLIYLTEDFVD